MQIARKLKPAINELEDIGFLEPLAEDERFIRDGRNWSVRFLRKSSEPSPSPPSPPVQPSPLIEALAERGVTRSTAADLVQRHPSELIERQLDVFDWLVEKQDKRIAKNPAGYLVESIRTPDGGYTSPKGFVSRAERQAQEEAKQVREREKADQKRHQQMEETRQQQRRQDADAYWSKLTPDEQAELQVAALDAAGETTRETYLTLKRHGGGKDYVATIRREYICTLLDAQKQAEPA